jgi:hypothetical protein
MSHGLTERTKMISRNLARRLEDLESRVVPVDEPPRVLTVEFVDNDRKVVKRMDVTLPRLATNVSTWRTR